MKYAMVRRSSVYVRGLKMRPWYVNTKEHGKLGRFPVQESQPFTTKESAEAWALRQGWSLVVSWAQAAEDEAERQQGSAPVAPVVGGKAGSSGPAISGQAACLLPKFSRAS